jgi:hypothetical protein
MKTQLKSNAFQYLKSVGFVEKLSLFLLLGHQNFGKKINIYCKIKIRKCFDITKKLIANHFHSKLALQKSLRKVCSKQYLL